MKANSVNLLRWNSSWDEIRTFIEAVLASDVDGAGVICMEMVKSAPKDHIR